MIQKIIHRPVAVSMAYLTIAALGFAAWRQIPLELLPDTDLPRLTVSAALFGSSPEVMEAFVTSPLEAEIQQVRGVEKISSESSENNARISIEFALETDMEFARLELSERVAAIEDDLPDGVITRIQQYVPEDFEDQLRPLLEYTLTGPYTLETLREYVDDELSPEIRQLDGVGTITAYGGRARILAIELDENRIRALGLQPLTVRQRISRMEFVAEAGAVLTGEGHLRTLAIRERTESADEVARLPVLMDQGRIVRIADVGRVYTTWEEPTQYYRIDGFPAVAFQVYRAPRSNAVATADRVKAYLDARTASHPSGVRVILDQDQSEDIKAQLTDLRTRALIAAAIVVLVLLLFLRSARAALIVFATVVFSVLITVNVMYWSGFTLNVLTLMGLAMGFGLVVDNAIVVLENTYRRRRLGEEPQVAARRGAGDVALAILASTGTTVVVLIPFVYLQGELRIYYVPLALVVGIALIASLAVAFTFIPAVGARLLGAIRPVLAKRESAEEGQLVSPGLQQSLVVRSYGGMIRGSLRLPWVTVVLALAALGGSWYVFDKYVSRGIIFGAFGEQRDRIMINIVQPRGEELERTDELARFFEARLREMPEPERFISRIFPERSVIDVYFPDSLQFTSIPVAIKEQLVQYSLLFGGTDVRVYGYGPSFYGGGGGASPNYSIKILGYNYEQVRLIAEDIARRLERFSRVREVDTNTAGNFWQRDKATEIVLDIDRRRLSLHDLSAREVVAYVASAVRGRNQQGETVRVDGEEMQLSVKLAGSRDIDMLGLENLLLPTANNREGVRVGDIATVRERQVLNRVIREDQQYQRIVSYEFRGPTKLGDRTLEVVLDATQLPPGYEIEERQVWAWSTEEKAQIWGVIAVALILIYMVTAAVFESLKLPFCVLLTVPMALIGVFLIFFYTRASFTREAYVGVIMMAGIVVNSAILLVDHVNQLRRREGMALDDALVRGTIERVRPILMTGLTTICGLLPLVLFSKNVNANIWNALAYTLIGGLASSMILVLTVTPALYLILERRAEKRRLLERAVPA
ncbi:MAG: efflux RND transporter permease subunit [Gemmatimonadetes bacterium]|nr:efflux RND transporter permease subunit [Gemmatimonadota bacterium]